MLVSLTLFSPLAGFLIAAILNKIVHYKYSLYVTSILIVFSSLCSWIIFLKIIDNSQTSKVYLFNWIHSGDFFVDWSLRVDALTSVMLIVVTNISAAVHIYSIGYMKGDNSIPRFMSYLSLFTFFMLTLVTSDNLLQMFFGWEGVGLASYLLIGFWHHKKSANDAAIKAFILNRIGDFGYLLGIVGIFFVFNTIYFDEIFYQIDFFKNQNINFLGFKVPTLDTLCILLFIGAMGKSAQLGLHTWLPDAMEGPTPVSALIHAATMVTAGVFMVCRMSPLFANAEIASSFVIFIGASTAIFAASIAITQNDIKRVIAYSTCSQLGYMFFAAGIGAYTSSMFHLMTHGFFKALLFLSAGSVIHAMKNEQDMRKMGGLSKKIPLTTTLMWIGSLAIIGFPFFSGYYSKESILESTYFSNTSLSIFAYFIGLFTATLTAFYSWRVLFMTFHGENRSAKDVYDEAHESPLIMIIPLIFLAIGSIVVGFAFVDLFVGNNSIKFWGNSIIIQNQHSEIMPFTQMFMIKLFSVAGLFIALLFYYYNTKLPIIFINKIRPLYLLSFNKWYVDEIYKKIFINSSFYLAFVLWKKGDEGTIDYFGPDGLSKMVKKFANACGKIQTGYLYHYAFAMLIGLIGFLSWYLYK